MSSYMVECRGRLFEHVYDALNERDAGFWAQRKSEFCGDVEVVHIRGLGNFVEVPDV